MITDSRIGYVSFGWMFKYI